MGHRHLLGTSQLFDDELEQDWDHIRTEQPYTNPARSGTSDNRSYAYLVNMAGEGMSFSSHWSSPPRPNGYGTSSHVIERPLYHTEASGPSHNPFLSSSTLGPFSTPPEHCMSHPSSSNYNSQTWQNGGFIDLTMGNVRGAQKRKSPSAPVCERGSSSQYNSDRGPSECPLPSESHLEKPTYDHQYMPWDQLPMNLAYRSNGLSIRGECSTRNVRSRPSLDLEASLDRNRLPSNTSLGSHSTGHFIDHVGSSDFPGQMSHTMAREWNYARTSPGPGDMTVFNPETNSIPVRSTANNASVETTGYQHGLFANSNSIAAPGFLGTATQPSSNARGTYSHRSIPTYRASSSALHLGHTLPPNERSHLVTETYPSRHQRPLPHVSWRSSDRSGRRRSSYERFQPTFNEVALHDRFSSEGFMAVDRHPAYYASRNMVDQHRDLRLDIDNMTYEELLALGERIGSVNTGLSNSSISKCLKETTFCSLLRLDEPSSCVICLEEYKEKEEIGELKGCEHNYHVGCIKKWLSMKNSCPICKASALSDDLKNK